MWSTACGCTRGVACEKEGSGVWSGAVAGGAAAGAGAGAGTDDAEGESEPNVVVGTWVGVAK